METFWQDLRYGARLPRLNPGLTAVAVLSLALGIGANTAIFQLLDAVRLRTLPVKSPQELAVVRVADRKWNMGRNEGRYSQLTNPMWEQIRDYQQGFSSIFAWAEATFNLAPGGEARYAQGMFVRPVSDNSWNERSAKRFRGSTVPHRVTSRRCVQ
jgi:putative ABC transport system permease protein